MFTAPKEEDIPLLDQDAFKVRSYQHDLVLNGYEIGGGSIRIHDPKIQEKIFDLIGFNQEQKAQFKHLLEAFDYGVPPHGGIALGIERLLMILLGEKSLKEVIAFPLTGDGRDPMMEAPSTISQEQLDEAHIKIVEKDLSQ
jgi:aspartyl-tRNA synthetase